MPDQEEKKSQKGNESDEEEKEEDEAAPQGLLDLSDVGEMKNGEYLVHMYVQEARQLQTQKESTVDPLVQLVSFGKKKNTSAKNDIGSAGAVYWGEHLFIESGFVQKTVAENAKITIRIMDKRTFKDALIGEYEMDLTHVYFHKKHTIFHRWFALCNPKNEDYTKVSGYIKVSISVIGTGDEQVVLKDDENDDSDSPILMPPQIQPKLMQLIFRFIRAQHLPKMDTFGTVDAFAKIKFGSVELKTKVVKQEDNLVEWHQELWIPMTMPTVLKKIPIQLYDYDAAKNDSIIGTIFANFRKITGDLKGQKVWEDVYGAVVGKSGKHSRRMNRDPAYASQWKGRVLVQYDSYMAEKVSLQEKNMDKKEAGYPKKTFTIKVEIDQGVALPSDTKYKIKVQIAELELMTDKPRVHRGSFCKWNKRFELEHDFPYPGIHDFPDVFVYLMDDDDPVCFKRFKPKDYRKPNPDMAWHQLQNDLSIGEVENHYEAGFIMMRVTVQDNEDFAGVDPKEHFESWPFRWSLADDVYQMVLHVYQLRDLPSADSSGSSDPYVKLHNFGSSQILKTNTIKETLNPIFYESILFYHQFNEKKYAPPIILDIYDWDALDSDDFIGRAVTTLDKWEMPMNEQKTSDPRWIPINIGYEGAPTMGEILISFSQFDTETDPDMPYLNKMIRPETLDATLVMNILGLRGLQSTGIIPVTSPFIEFNLKALVPPDEQGNLRNIKTQANASGPNPNINSVIKTKLPLPIEKLYCPRISCVVYDEIFKGLIQPLLGTFTIPIGDLMHELADEMPVIEGNLQKVKLKIDEILIYERWEKERKEQEARMAAQKAAAGVKPIASKKVAAVVDTIDNTTTALEREMKEPLLVNQTQSPRTEAAETARSDLPKILGEERKGETSLSGGVSLGGGASLGGGGIGASVGANVGASVPSPPTDPKKLTGSVTGSVAKAAAPATAGVASVAKNIEMSEAQSLLERVPPKPSIWGEDEETVKRRLKFQTMIIKPEYEYNQELKMYKEINEPNPAEFLGLGYDEKPTESNQKQYRRYFETELEDVEELVGESPFDQFDIIRGQSRGASKSVFSQTKMDEAGQASTVKTVGEFKGLINVYDKARKEQFMQNRQNLINGIAQSFSDLSELKMNKRPEINWFGLDDDKEAKKLARSINDMQLQTLDIPKAISDSDKFGSVAKKLLVPTKCVVRIYIIGAYGLLPKDSGSDSDPFLVLKLGKKKIDDRANRFEDQPNPEWFKSFEFDAVMPGASLLKVQLWDYDALFSDELIGETIIDLEDRFFSPRWQTLHQVPIEYRSLFHPTSSIQQGQLKCWVEIHPLTEKVPPALCISPQPEMEFEVRVVIWKTRDIKTFDVEGTSDIYIRSFIDNKDPQETDTHWRCQNGKGSFNWRMKFRVKFPRTNYRLTLQVYDRDVFSGNDYIGDATFDFEGFAEDVFASRQGMKYNRKYYKKYVEPKIPEEHRKYAIKWDDDYNFWVPVMCKNDESGQLEKQGDIRIQIDIQDLTRADANPNGKGRSDPNHSPFLPPPEGRIKWSLNPFTMLNQLVGPEFRRKLYCALCICLCLVICAFVFPIFFSDFISGLFLKIFGL